MAYNKTMPHANPTERYDVTLIGGGLVGAAQAIALAREGCSVALIDAVSQDAQLDTQFDGRTCAIADGSQRILENIGVWPHIEEAQPIRDIRVCDQEASAVLHFDHKEVGERPFGYIVENRFIRQGLFTSLKQYDTIHCYIPDKAIEIDRREDGVSVTLESGRMLDSALLIAADGKFSKTRDAAGIDSEVISYKQTAIVLTIAHEKPHHGLAVEKFMPAGPFAILPLTGNRSGIVWSVEERMAAHYLSLPEEELIRDIGWRVGDFLGELTLVSKPYSHPLILLKAQRYIDKRLVLVGDAAHAIHPIAGQGVNVGYRDVAVLTEMLREQAGMGLDIGSSILLEAYESRRRFDVMSMSAATDQLNKLFSTHNPLVTHARRFGLEMVNHMPRAKRFFMRHAMGDIGILPALMRDDDREAA